VIGLDACRGSRGACDVSLVRAPVSAPADPVGGVFSLRWEA
jgi:hypothetical protein